MTMSDCLDRISNSTDQFNVDIYKHIKYILTIKPGQIMFCMKSTSFKAS